MANTTLTPSIISKETLDILENNLVMAAKVNRQFENQFVKIGSTLTIRKPNRFTVSTGQALSIQNIVEPSTSVTISNQIHVDFQFSSQELTLVIEEFSERYCKPAAAALANRVDSDVAALWPNVWNEVGTPGTTPTSFATSVQLVGQRMDEGAVPQSDRCLVLNPAAHWSIANGLTALYVQSVAEPALKGYLAKIGNFSVYMDQNVPTQTVGALGGTPDMAGAGQTGASIDTDGWTATTGAINAGDVFTIAGVYSVNPQSRVSTGVLQDFVATADATADGAGAMTIAISPSIITSGAYQTVDSAPADGADLTIKGTAATNYPQNLAFTPDAFGLVMVPLELYQGQDFMARNEYKGLSMRIWRQPDITNDNVPCRIDMLYGTAAYYPEMAVRLAG